MQLFLSFVILISVGIFFIQLIWAERSDDERFCPTQTLLKSESHCISCNIKDYCGPNSELIPESPDEWCYGSGINMCQGICTKNLTIMTCCAGFWGPSCIECPGGAENPCNGNGQCQDGKCTCNPKYTGIACEKCRVQNTFGPNCTDCSCFHGTCDRGMKATGKCYCDSGYKGPTCNEEILQCKLSQCEDVCAEDDDGKIVCRCLWGFAHDEDGVCKAIDPCLSNPCSQNALCTTTGVGKYVCTCPINYELIGNVCEEVNPCRENNGGCPTDTSICRHIGPGQKMCKCNLGYKWNNDTGCEIIDLCSLSQNECHPMAICTTEIVGETTCRCKEGYVGDGRKDCFGNIIQMISRLNSNDTSLQSMLGKFLTLVSSNFKGELIKHGNYTIFVPMDTGFKNVERDMTFDELLANKERCRQILRQHILPARVRLDDLTNITLYTLQGTSTRFIYKKNKLNFKFRGSSKRSGVIDVGRDIIASNGIIHIVTKLMPHEPEINGDPDENVSQFIRNVKFNKFESIFTYAGVEDVFNKDNITVFVPINFQETIPPNILTYLTSRAGQGALLGLLKNHVFNSRMTITDLIDKKHIKSISGTSFKVRVELNGQIFFGENAYMTQSDIPTKNAIVHLIDGVLFPDDIQKLLPGRCDHTSNVMVRGECGPCTSRLPCDLSTDIPTSRIYSNCSYLLKDLSGTKEELGCQILCERSYRDPQCCPGFFGPECAACPGNFNKPCYGRGKCFDGINGNGTCACKPGFGGVACQNCANPDVYGPACDKKCTCINGICRRGIYGNGRCKRKSCRLGFSGADCERRLVECNGKRAICHVYTVCAADGSVSCECLPGYEGNGIRCTEVNPCEKPDRGGCHEQATCTYTEPGQNKCKCRDGWTGDGTYCYPAQFCTLKSECDSNAVCENTGAGGFICICHEGFRGNGKQCQPENPCLINNGGCDPRAKCTMVGIGKRSCVCPVGYAGQGMSCLSTIRVEVHDRPELSEFYSLIQDVPDFWQLGEKYTLFAPNNAAILNFKKMASFMYWQDPTKIINLISFHTLNDSYNIDTLQQLHGEKFHTIMEGFTVNIYVNKSTTIIKTRVTKANILTPDIPADNGYIHIIDKVLEPFPATKDRPNLIEFFENHKEFSLFGNQLVESGMVDRLMMMDEYTLFVPLDAAVKTFNKNLSFRFLSYYTLPMTLMSENIYDGMTMQTMLGQFYQLLFNVRDNQVLVNNITVIKSDILTVGGIIHIISDLLKPILHRCDNKVLESLKTDCKSCHQEANCPLGYEKTAVLKHTCSYPTKDGSVLGCTAICKKLKVTPECCYGYYGPNCNECPGGADYPCTGHGSCSDGMNGTGRCLCQLNFAGADCSKCAEGKTGPDCSSKFDNCGSCGPNAECHETVDGFECVCQYGFLSFPDRGCLSKCYAANGGCHQNARCTLDDSGSEIPSIVCSCRDGYYGDGKKSCLPIVNLCNTNNGNCSPRAICTFTPPTATDTSAGKVTCECHESYVGNGTTCNRDIFSTLQFMPSMHNFYELLISSEWNGDKDREILIDLLEDLESNVTIFVPISGLSNLQNISNIDLENHILLGKILISPLPSRKSHKTLTGQILEIETDASGKQYVIQESINKIRIIESNILNVNGFINLIESPLWFDYVIPKTAKSLESRKVVAIIVPILFILLAIGLFFLYRKYAANMTCRDLWQRYKMMSDTKISFAHLKSHESHEMLQDLSQPLNTDVQNPIFGPQDLLLDEMQQPS